MAIILFLLSILLGGVGAWILKAFAFRSGFIDCPNGRSSHGIPTPKGGGIGILAAFILSALFLKIGFTFWVPAACLALLSFFADRFELSPKIRLLLQFIAAVVLVLSAFSLQPSAFLLFFLVVFVVATTNWYNFMDGINGIAGITGIVGFVLLALFGFINNVDSRFPMLSICIAFSCLGFLPFNIPRAKVFMGDVGSILLGFVFAAIVIMFSKSFLDFVCLVSFLFPFYADELLTMVVRIKDGENLLHPHRRHLYQLLANERGIAHWKVSAGYGIVQLAVGVSILLIKDMGSIAVILMLAIYFGVFAGVGFAIRKKVAQRSF